MNLGYDLMHREYIICLKVLGKNPNKVVTVSNDSVSIWSSHRHLHRDFLLLIKSFGTLLC